MTREKAIETARKLLALATSDNPNEAAAAAAQAQAILDRYEITRAALEAEGTADDEPDEPIENFHRKGAPLEGGRAVAVWRQSLASVLADVSACQVYKGGGIQIVGRGSDVEKVHYLYAYLCREVDRLADRDGKGCGRTWRNNFRLGAVETITKALRAARQAAIDELKREAGANSLALVKIDNAVARLDRRRAEVEAWTKANLKLRSCGRSYYRGDRDARAAGREAGREVNIGGARGALGAGRRQIRGGG